MKKKYISLLLLAFLFVTCNQKDAVSKDSVIYLEDEHQSDFDQWLYETFTKPYNIEVKWKWDDTEIDNSFHVTPPQKQKARQIMEALHAIWIKPYEQEAGTEFIKTYVPKLIYLVGTPQFNQDGTKTLGLAEGGRKITLFDVDSFDNQDLDKMTKAFHTMHHEFAHILHQKIAFSTTYKDLTKGQYTGAWFNVSEVRANARGFITPYSMSNENEDFVEVAATILSTVQNSNSPIQRIVPEKDDTGNVTGNLVSMNLTDFQLKLYMFGISIQQQSNGSLRIVQEQTAPQGLNTMLKKIDMVSDYYKEVWGIDLFRLQGKIEQATNELILQNTP
ncbi:putative zinc-binding metallopeptidase [Capnocytophaga canimorsus]|uniref:Substrate import-associated zinc metallohydrolase lipoprotein n=1 Tax=Capnocytophaga canimorsus TaxID=28188 RepID=A0A0B7IE03_9FLAO|nr:putative zinc-binding metallopeptidase [Capnocytophaga canimorsus]CEN50005.1 conserved exported hypothetical protein [Capnocytophaga canimorsus]